MLISHLLNDPGNNALSMALTRSETAGLSDKRQMDATIPDFLAL